MLINGFEKLSLVDFGSKTAATVFTGGCNFLCPFCHNGPIVTDFHALPTFTEQEILEYLKKRKGLVDGVCVSGGEPTLQKDLPNFLTKIKELDYPIKLDTNGTTPKILKKLIDDKLIDYVAMDVKNGEKKYAKTVGLKNLNFAPIKESVDLLINGNVEYEFRTTIVKELHNEKDFLEIGQLINGAEQCYIQRFERREGCIVQGLTPVDEEVARKMALILKKFVKHVYLRGY